MVDNSTGARRNALADKLTESMHGPIPDATPRKVNGHISLPGKVTAVIGVRRAGKTMFLHQLRAERLAAGSPRELLPYVNFEDERLVGLSSAELGFLVEEFERRRPDGSRGRAVTWCFDEIQCVSGWERFVRRLLDAGNCEIVVSGSSAAMLSREIATALRGRGWEVALYPFSFAEALVHGGRKPPEDPELLSPRQRASLEQQFGVWLDTGGFPEVQALDASARRQMLGNYVDVAMLRDVLERHHVGNVAGLRWLVRHLLGNAGASFSIEKFHAAIKSQGLAISRDTVHQLLAHLDDCFLVRVIWMESDSERQRMVNPRKSYPVDTGLIPLFDRRDRANTGHALETAVLIELQRRHCEVTYVRTRSGFEVDFLAKRPDGTQDLIQVCTDARDADTAARELRALAEARVQFPHAQPRLLTLTRDGGPPSAPDWATVETAYAWMLRGSD
jgi:predicted AAA+ superfamily ATPase